jgi:hypothetical protein
MNARRIAVVEREGQTVLRYVSRALTGEDWPTIGVYLFLGQAAVALAVSLCLIVF